MKPNANFETITYGKWILAGEHAVLRGSSAILFPVTSKTLTLTYAESQQELKARFIGPYVNEMQVLFWGAWSQALQLLQLSQTDIRGEISINNQVPIGTGMGGSAALCVAIGRFFHFKGFIQEEQILEFSRQIENIFHQESSGADIAVSLAGKGIIYSRQTGIRYLNPSWKPNWYLSFSGHYASTSHCVTQVKNLFEQDLNKALLLDEKMKAGVELAYTSLQLPENLGLPKLVEAIDMANDCFKQWGLADGKMEEHLIKLRQLGAIAVKPTGSGQGGYALSLWDKEPPKDEGISWIKV